MLKLNLRIAAVILIKVRVIGMFGVSGVVFTGSRKKGGLAHYYENI